MTKKKTTVKKIDKIKRVKITKVETRPNVHTTIRMIRDQVPCGDEYRAFLKDFKGFDPKNPLNDKKEKGAKEIDLDDPISILDILNKESSGDMDGGERVYWLLETGSTVPDLQSLINADQRAMALRILKILDRATIERLFPDGWENL